MAFARSHLALDPAVAERPDDALRIVVVLPTLNPYGGVISVVNAMNILIDQGHDVTMVSLSRTGNDLVHPKTEPIFAPDRTDIVALVGVEYDIALATSWETVAPVSGLVEANPHIGPCYYVQGFEADLFASEADKQRVLQTYETIPTRIVKTAYLAQRLADHGFDSHRIPPGMDLDVFYPRSGPPSTRPRRVVAMARPDSPQDHRGFGVLVDAFVRLQAQRPEIEIVLFGTEELPDDLGFGFEDVGRVAPEELPTIYSDAAVYLDTSLLHGFGRTGVEAMACGCACVLSDSGGISEYAVAGENALIVPVGDAAAAADAVGALFEDPDRMDELATHGLDRVQRLTDYAATEAMLGVFRAAAGGGS